MRSIFLTFVALLAMLPILTSCEKEKPIIQEAHHASVYVRIVDKDGISLLDPEVIGNLVRSNIYVMKDGRQYDIHWNTTNPQLVQTATNHFYGACHYRDSVSGKADDWVIEIGKFAGDQTYDKTISLFVKGEEHKIRVTNQAGFNSIGEPTTDFHISMDGVESNFGRFTITLSEEGFDPSDYETDFSPIIPHIRVNDKTGNNLLNPDTPGNIIGTTAYIEYNDARYDVAWNTKDPRKTRALSTNAALNTNGANETRALPAIFYGAWHYQLYQLDADRLPQPVDWVMDIGELPGGDNLDITIPIHLRGEKHTLRITNRAGVENRKIKVDRHFYIDGTEQTGSILTLTLNS